MGKLPFLTIASVRSTERAKKGGAGKFINLETLSIVF
jgi:hypothetical protein